MAMVSITVRLDRELDYRLVKLAEQTHKSKGFYVNEALKEYLSNREDYLLALAAYEEKEPTINIVDVRKELRLEG